MELCQGLVVIAEGSEHLGDDDTGLQYLQRLIGVTAGLQGGVGHEKPQVTQGRLRVADLGESLARLVGAVQHQWAIGRHAKAAVGGAHRLEQRGCSRVLAGHQQRNRQVLAQLQLGHRVPSARQGGFQEPHGL